MPLSHRSLHGVREREARERNGVRVEDPDMIVGKLMGRQGLPVDSEVPNVIEAPTRTTGLGTDLAQDTGTPSPSVTAPAAGKDSLTTASLIPEPTESGSGSAGSSADSESGMSTAVIAGIIIGVLGGLGVIGFFTYLIVSRRRKQQGQGRDDEKSHGSGIETSQVRAAQRPPRLSLRPVTQLFGWGPDKPAARGAATLAPGMANSRSLGPNAFERPDTSQSMHPNNPFGNQAERVPTPVREEHSMDERRVDRSLPPTPAGDASNQDPMAAYGANLTRKTSMRKDGPKNLDLTLNLSKPLDPVPASPGSVYSDVNGASGQDSQSTAAIAAAGGPVNSLVHRVQLDFKPTLEDEMELRAGEIVRLLHEYDDGWALCLRMDRTKQGVVPRTCLSTRPVKPRAPAGAPHPSQQRGPAPGPQQRSMTPQGMRSQSPAGPRTNMGPASPGRSMSPGPRFQGNPAGRPRSPSANGMGRPGAGPGPSPMNPSQAQIQPNARLPGQAL